VNGRIVINIGISLLLIIQ